MRILRSDGSIIEGTVAEIAAFEALQFASTRKTAVNPNDEVGSNALQPIESADQDWEYVSSDHAFRVLTRLKLSKEQKSMLKLIYSSGSKWTSASDIQNHINYRPSQFAGMMGAFGRRLVNTPGYILHSAFFEQEWSDEKSCYLYRLPPSVRAAVEKSRIAE